MRKAKNKRLEINFDFYLNDLQTFDNQFLTKIENYTTIKCLNCLKNLIVFDVTKLENQLCKNCKNSKLEKNQLKFGLLQISEHYRKQTIKFLNNL